MNDLIYIYNLVTGEAYSCNRLKPILRAIERSAQWAGIHYDADCFISNSRDERVAAWVRSELDYRFRARY